MCPALPSLFAVAVLYWLPALALADAIPVEGQPLGANILRVNQALDFLGHALPADLRSKLEEAARSRNSAALQDLMDAQCLAVITINPESRVKAVRGVAKAVLQQHGYTPVLLKVINQGSVTAPLHVTSPQAGPVYGGLFLPNSSLARQQQVHLMDDRQPASVTSQRFLDVDVFSQPPMTSSLSGLEVEYVIALLFSTESGKREATLSFDVGQGTQDLGFRAELPILFDVRPAIELKLSIHESDGTPTVGRLMFTDTQGHVYPPQPKRFAPDFFFQKQIYRPNGGTVWLPPGKFNFWSGRGPEYHWQKRKLEIKPGVTSLDIKVERWVNPADYGFYSGDHHIHPAGCAHYTSPTEGMLPEHMFQQIKGEGLNVGCMLNWAYSFDFQRKFFSATPDQLSEPFTVMKYDMEVSGFGSAALGHVCLLNLRELVYPGADGVKGWPTWTLPVMRWTREQGGVAGYAHSAGGLQIDGKAAAKRFLDLYDINKDKVLDDKEAQSAPLPEPFNVIDVNRDGLLDFEELTLSHNRAGDRLPNVAVPEMNGSGAQEIFVTAALGQCDFISSMNTARIPEWNCWYHLMNCGLPVKASGETDFPCMSGTRVGQGRVYVQLGKVDHVDFKKWCNGIRAGQSYVSDGYAHALDFKIDNETCGATLRLEAPKSVHVTAKVAFSGETPLEVEYGGATPTGGLRFMGDTVTQHPATTPGVLQNQQRLIEIVVNGEVKAKTTVPADSQPHDLSFTIPITRSSWIALRHFPQLHTNPVDILIANQPIRASRQSAQWCLACIDQLWREREKVIQASEREAARKAYDEARAYYRKVVEEAP